MNKDKCKYLNEACKNTLVETLGIKFIASGEDWLEASMPIDTRTCRPDGALHGGANMALAETLGGALGSISVEEGKEYSVYGIEINGNHIKRAEGKFVIGRAEFIHKGRRSQVVNVEIRDEKGKIVTINRVTNMVVI